MQTTTGDPRRIRRSDRGEGVISTAIAVLIMAFLGAAMWFAFNGMWETTESNTNDQVNQIGTTNGGATPSTVGN